MLDIFSSNAFGHVEMTGAINRLKRQYGLIGELGLFGGSGVRTTAVAIEEVADSLNLITSQPRGATPTYGEPVKRKVHSMVIPHRPHLDVIRPDDVQNVRAFGQDSGFETADSVMMKRLARAKRKHEQTLEYMRCKALEGILVDADGSTLLNLWSLLSKSRKEIDMLLGIATTNVIDKLEEALDHVESNAEGETINGFVGICGATFWSKLTAHAKVTAAFANWGGQSNLLGQDLRKGFPFCGITFVKYIGSATYVSPAGTSTTRQFVPPGDCLVVPLGTQDTFQERYAPANQMEYVNTVGVPYYARREMLPKGAGVEVHTESNILPYCTRPQVVVRLHSSN